MLSPSNKILENSPSLLYEQRYLSPPSSTSIDQHTTTTEPSAGTAASLSCNGGSAIHHPGWSASSVNTLLQESAQKCLRTDTCRRCGSSVIWITWPTAGATTCVLSVWTATRMYARYHRVQNHTHSQFYPSFSNYTRLSFLITIHSLYIDKNKSTFFSLRKDFFTKPLIST